MGDTSSTMAVAGNSTSASRCRSQGRCRGISPRIGAEVRPAPPYTWRAAHGRGSSAIGPGVTRYSAVIWAFFFHSRRGGGGGPSPTSLHQWKGLGLLTTALWTRQARVYRATVGLLPVFSCVQSYGGSGSLSGRGSITMTKVIAEHEL